MEKKTLSELKAEKPAQTLYKRPCDYNRAKALVRFFELLEENGRNIMFHRSSYDTNTHLIESVPVNNYNDDSTEKDEGFVSPFAKDFTPGYATFEVNGWLYYVQFDDNPLFEYSSFFKAQEIKRDEDGEYVTPVYAGRKNINEVLPDGLWGTNFDVEVAAKALFDLFAGTYEKHEGQRIPPKRHLIARNPRRYGYEEPQKDRHPFADWKGGH